MASMRDAMGRLQTIHDACNPDAVAAKQAEAGLDQFQRLRRQVGREVRTIRTALREREDVLAAHGTTPETAEQSYRIRLQIRGVREAAGRMRELVDKDERRLRRAVERDRAGEPPANPKDAERVAELKACKEVVELAFRHIEEVEMLEKRRFNEGVTADRGLLLAGASDGPAAGGVAGRARATGNYGAASGNYRDLEGGGADPFLDTGLPDLDVEEDFKALNEQNRAVDEDIEVIGAGVAKLKQMAHAMGEELDRQNDDLVEVDRKVNKALDHVDNVNIKMRKIATSLW
ncbi:hypothetical protein HK405_004900 [Cladochytrium tenue]|nr:hypothetical protein HK405_004900 [Cladochytrium tenue]